MTCSQEPTPNHDPVCTFPSFFNIHFNIIRQSTAWSFTWSLTIGVRVRTLYVSSSYVPHTPPIWSFLIWSPEWCSVTRATSECTKVNLFYPAPPPKYIIVSFFIYKGLVVGLKLGMWPWGRNALRRLRKIFGYVETEVVECWRSLRVLFA